MLFKVNFYNRDQGDPRKVFLKEKEIDQYLTIIDSFFCKLIFDR